MGIFSRRKKSGDPVHPEPTESTFRELNDAERAFVDDQLGTLAEMQVDIHNSSSIAAAYDRLHADWAAVPEADRANPKHQINLIGIALGENLVQSTAMEWGIASDVFGVEIAVRDEKTDWQTFPVNSVAKRWFDDEEGSFVDAFVTWIKSSITESPAQSE